MQKRILNAASYKITEPWCFNCKIRHEFENSMAKFWEETVKK